MKKEYYGNFLGMVINSSDPEYRGRVQVFVPHVMPALYEGWNKEGKDIQISCVGSNIPEGLTPEIHARLVKILPWAESASPIIGASAPGNLFSDFTNAVKSAAGTVAGAVGAVAETVGSQFVQTPTTNPVAPTAGNNGNLNSNQLVSIGGGHKLKPYVAEKFNELKAAAARDGISLGVTDSYRSEEQQQALVDQQWLSQTGKYRKKGTNGTVPVAKPGTSKHGLGNALDLGGSGSTSSAQAYAWLKQNAVKYGWSNYKGQKADPGIEPWHWQINEDEIPANYGSSDSNESAANAAGASPNELAKTEGPYAAPETAPVPQSNVSGEGQGISGTVSGGGTATTGNSKLASDRQARFGSENQEATMARLQVLASREVGNNPAAIQAFTESVVNRAYFSNRSLDKVLYESGYGFTDRTTASPSPAVREAFSKVMGGSNMTNLATDAGFNLPNSGRGKGGLFITGMQSKDYVITGAIDNKTGQQITDPELLNKLYTEGDKTGKYEFFVRQSRATSAEGIEKYAQENGIKSDGFQSDILPTLDATSTSPTSTSVVNNTDGNGRTPIVNTNDMANGMFAYPNPGAMVWIFFREGNPLYPVYFAASYSAAEWKSAYRGGSPGDYMSHEDPSIRVITTVDKKNSAGVIISKSRTNLMNALDNESVFTLAHQHGSNITFKDGCDFHYSRNNKRDEVESDRFVITRGYKEQWIEGDDSTNVRGNITVKVGKIDPESIKAAQELSDFSYELNQILMVNAKK